jgi:signal transduction histidine kinase
VKGLVGTRTALAWMGMMSSIWRHGIEINAATIRNQAELLREEVRRLRGGKPLLSEINRIIRSAKEILKKRPVSPLGVQAEATAVPLRGLVEDWARRWRGRLAEQSVSLQEHLTLEPEATVRAGPEWLHRAWDLLIENAVAATCGRAGRQIRLTCLRAGPQHAELFITDNGPGIPEELNPIILREVIPHKKSKGFGVGLLLAQTIIETYEGELKVDSTGPQGTTIKVSLPLEESDTLPPTRHKARRKT